MCIWFCLEGVAKKGKDTALRSVCTQQWQAKSRGITKTWDDPLQSAGTAEKVLRSERLQIFLVMLLIEQNAGYRRKYEVIMDIWCLVGVCKCGWTCYSSTPNSRTGSCWDCRPRRYPFHHTRAYRMKWMEPVRVFLSVLGQPMWLRSVPQNKLTLNPSYRGNVPIRPLGCINSTSGCSHMHTHAHMCGKMGSWWGGAWKRQ